MADKPQDQVDSLSPPLEAPPKDNKNSSTTKKRASQLSWDKSSAFNDDCLLMCLEIISGLLDRPMSAAALKAGLPLEKNRLGPEQFVRAAMRAGLSARIVKKKLKDLTQFTVPCVLLLDGNKACVMTRLSEEGMAQIIIPETGRGTVDLHIDDLKVLYSGYAIFARPQYRYDQRSIDLDIEKPHAWFWGVIGKFWPIYSKVAISAFLVNMFALATPLFSMNVYDRVIPNNAMDTLVALSIGIFLVYTFEFLLKVLRVYFVDTAGKNADILLASRLFEHVMGMRMDHKPLSSGAFASELREFETLREFFSSASLVALVDLPFIVLFVAVSWMIGGELAWISLVAIALIVIGSLLFHSPLSAWVRRAFREAAQKHALLVEAITGMETVKSFGAEGQMQRNWERFVAQSADSARYLKLLATVALSWSSFVQQIAYVSLIIYGVILINKGDLTMGGLIACSILVSRGMAPLSQVVSLLTRLNQSQAALEALNKIIKAPTERPPGTTFLHHPKLTGQIEFKEIYFSYPGQKITALKNFNLKVEAGEKIGILGRIGSGKSTLEKLLLGLYQPSQGSVWVDGKDARQIDPADLRGNIGYVPQDIYLFYGTVRDNIGFGMPEVDDELILKAAEISGVWDFVKRHPRGFDMPVGEAGACLSGGQRQAIAVARAIIRNPSIFVMDEPTAMMDHASEFQFIERFEPFIRNKTLLLITHRMPLLKLIDRLIVMDGGKVVADGPRDEVIKALSNSQIRGTGA